MIFCRRRARRASRSSRFGSRVREGSRHLARSDSVGILSNDLPTSDARQQTDNRHTTGDQLSFAK